MNDIKSLNLPVFCDATEIAIHLRDILPIQLHFSVEVIYSWVYVKIVKVTCERIIEYCSKRQWCNKYELQTGNRIDKIKGQEKLSKAHPKNMNNFLKQQWRFSKSRSPDCSIFLSFTKTLPVHISAEYKILMYNQVTQKHKSQSETKRRWIKLWKTNFYLGWGKKCSDWQTNKLCGSKTGQIKKIEKPKLFELVLSAGKLISQNSHAYSRNKSMKSHLIPPKDYWNTTEYFFIVEYSFYEWEPQTFFFVGTRIINSKGNNQ